MSVKALLAVAALALAGCHASIDVPPPSQWLAAPAGGHHLDIPATDDRGTVWHVCATRPRQYSDGLEVDHYLQRATCPAQEIP